MIAAMTRAALTCGLLLPAALFACSETNLRPVPVDVDPSLVTECGFTPVDGVAGLSSYDCNPVFTTTDEDWARLLTGTSFNHTEVVGHAFYQMWYLAYRNEVYPNQTYDIGYAVSPDGTTWEPYPDNPLWPAHDNAAWDADRLQRIFVDWDSSLERYVMMYGGINFTTNQWGIGLATSPEGITWERHFNNPIVDINAEVNGVKYCWPLSFRADAGTFDALIAGVDDPMQQHCELFRVRTDDLDEWDPQNEKILPAGSPGAWDDEGFISASIVEYEGVQYLFYVGFGAWIQEGNILSTQNQYLGLALSTDGGASWSRAFDAPIPINNTEEGQVNMVAARVVGSRIHLWVEDSWPELQRGAVGYFLFEPAESGLVGE